MGAGQRVLMSSPLPGQKVTTTAAVSCRAWMGYRSACPLTVAACAWCPDVATVNEWARQSGTVVTHTICAECQGRQLRLVGIVLPADQVGAGPTDSRPADQQTDRAPERPVDGPHSFSTFR